jgi:hypothetical protein
MANDNEPSDTSVPKNDAYTGMLAVSLIALIVGSVLLFLDYNQHSAAPPKFSMPQVTKFEAKGGGAPPPELAPKDGGLKDGALKDGALKDGALKDGALKDAGAKDAVKDAAPKDGKDGEAK